ncbi:alpha/beta-hydrolase [Daedaleopsis nitida]|nr:alpha/beta-hydrolase [Daedaleopsis nitida]
MFSNLSLFLRLAIACGLPLLADAATVKLDNATVIGLTNNSVTTFYGLRYAQPPLGDLRLRLPKSVPSYTGTINATLPGVECIQMSPPLRSDLPLSLLTEAVAYTASISTPGVAAVESEDCLTINVQVPEGTKSGAKLPVIAIIYGGGFVTGSANSMSADVVIRRSVELKQPVVVVAMNYRLAVFSQIGGKEVKAAGVGNLALQDQREALRWTQKYIAAFGGDPSRVTLWGVSAGAISIASHLLANGGNTEGLFSGAVMNAGSPVPTGDITNLQPYYDQLVEKAGCASANDTLDCLRHIPAATLLAAGKTLPNLFDYAGLATIWAPYGDGVFLKESPQRLVLSGSVAKIPFITGDALDEGTVFALSAFNITTEDEFHDYVNQYFYPSAPRDKLSPLFKAYPNDPAQGSPFNTGDAYQLADDPMYKRMAAFQGDFVWEAPRRFFLDNRASKQSIWSYFSERSRVADLGFPHGTDMAQALSDANELADYIIQFAATGNPNGASNRTISWPKYDAKSRKMLIIDDDGLEIGADTARLSATGVLTGLSLAYPL